MKPTLVILAAGLGSRYGGLKQMAPVDDAGHIIIDYSLYDAYRAGFRDVVCIINPKYEDDFKEQFKHTSKKMNITYAHQMLDMLPAGVTIPDGREKPWGTAHALLSAMPQIHGPFAVINADDFYGAGAYKLLYDFLANKATDTHHAMVGYHIENTLTESGYVARGVCSVQDGLLAKINERTQIKPAPGGAAFTENGEDFTFLPAGTIVSMNMWAFGQGVLTAIESRFAPFLAANMEANPLKCEYLLPSVVGELIEENQVTVDVLPTVDKWHGVTYQQDMPSVQTALAELRKQGMYPNKLWEEQA